LPSKLSRRHFIERAALGTGGLILGASGLASCTGSRDAAARVVRISNWPLYIDAESLADFERVTGIHTIYTEDVNDNNQFFAKLEEPLKRGQSVDRDVIVMTDWMVERMIQRGYCASLDDTLFPNKANLRTDLADTPFDPAHRFTVPWMLGMVGIAYNPRKTGRELTSIADLFDPALEGQVTFVGEMRDTVGLLMLADGRDPAQATLADVQAACATVETYRRNGQIRAFTGNEYVEDLASGNIAAAIAWSGDIAGIAADNPDLRFIAPREGGLRYADVMFVPATSDRMAEAMAWMNYVYQPAVSARIVKSTMYISPVAGALDELAKTDPVLAASPLVNPPDELRRRLHVFRALTDEEDQEYHRLFRQAIGA